MTARKLIEKLQTEVDQCLSGYKTKWIKCCLEFPIGGTYLAEYGYDFTCARCGKRYRSKRNIRAEKLGLIPREV